jgi:hypothetical protein
MRGINLDGVPVAAAPIEKPALADWMVEQMQRELIDSVTRSLFSLTGSLGKFAERSREAEIAQIEFRRAYAAGIYTTGGS